SPPAGAGAPGPAARALPRPSDGPSRHRAYAQMRISQSGRFLAAPMRAYARIATKGRHHARLRHPPPPPEPSGGVMTALRYDVFVAAPIPQAVTELVPNGDRRMFSPLSVTLVSGERDAVLVDPPLTTAQTEQVGD